MHGYRLLISVVILFVAACAMHAQVRRIYGGTIIDSASGAPVAARVLLGTSGRCAYTDSEGAFRIEASDDETRVSIRATGYAEMNLHLSEIPEPIIIALRPITPSPSGDHPSAEIIMRRALERVADWRRKLRSIAYIRSTTLHATMHGSIIVRRSGDEIITSPTIGSIGNNTSVPYRFEEIARESWSAECGGTHRETLRRTERMTASPAELRIFTEPIDLLDDRIEIINGSPLSPLAPSAASFYSFTYRGSAIDAGRMLYVIELEPLPGIEPGLRGIVKIESTTFDPVEIELSTVDSTSIASVRAMRIRQLFEEIGDGVHAPAFQQVDAEIELRIVRFIGATRTKLRATTTWSDRHPNAPLASDFCERHAGVTIDRTADSASLPFSERLALAPLSSIEATLHGGYDSTDSGDSAAGNRARRDPFLSGTIFPYIDYNRVGAEQLGITLNVAIGRGALEAVGFYSYGLHRVLGEVSLSAPILRSDPLSLHLELGAFNRIMTTGNDRSYPQIVNAASSWMLHSDYYDYYLAKGWRLTLGGALGDLRASLQGELAHASSMRNITTRFNFGNESYRANPAILDGYFRTVRGTVAWGTLRWNDWKGPSQPVGLFRLPIEQEHGLAAAMTGLHGAGVGSGAFTAIEWMAGYAAPTFSTGYRPMMLRIAMHGGVGSSALPPQYQFRMRSSTGLLGSFGDFYTAPIGRYGGTSYMAMHIEHDFSDLLWRLAGLPRHEGRGLDLSVGASASLFEQRAERGYSSTGGRWYGEAGIGIGRIPLPFAVSNLLFLRLDLRYGLGELARGRFGGSVGLSSPF